jgi:hypothetical protein
VALEGQSTQVLHLSNDLDELIEFGKLPSVSDDFMVLAGMTQAESGDTDRLLFLTHAASRFHLVEN